MFRLDSVLESHIDGRARSDGSLLLFPGHKLELGHEQLHDRAYLTNELGHERAVMARRHVVYTAPSMEGIQGGVMKGVAALHLVGERWQLCVDIVLLGRPPTNRNYTSWYIVNLTPLLRSSSISILGS